MEQAIALTPGAGNRIGSGGMNVTTKATMSETGLASTFELVIPPGFDSGAHTLLDAAEVIYVREGELDAFAFEPVDRSRPDWHQWQSSTGEHYVRDGPGTFLFVPPDTPHAFSNPSDTSTTLLFIPVDSRRRARELLPRARRSRPCCGGYP